MNKAKEVKAKMIAELLAQYFEQHDISKAEAHDLWYDIGAMTNELLMKKGYWQRIP